MKILPMLAQSKPENGSVPVFWHSEPKLDGTRLIIQKINGKVGVYTRTKIDQSSKLPKLVERLLSIEDDFIIDAEAVVVSEYVEVEGLSVPLVDFSAVQTSLRTSLGNEDAITFFVFDCMMLNDSVVDVPEVYRYEKAGKIVGMINLDNVKLMPRWNHYNDSLYEECVNHGMEGIMVKNPLAKYVPNKRPKDTWVKLKANDTADVVVVGYKPGEGKYKDLIGSIEFGQFKDGVLVRKGFCSGMDDDTRIEISRNKGKFINQVMEIRYFGKVGPEKNFRHPNFLRWRDDKSAEDCTWS